MAGGEEVAQALWYVGAGPGRNPAGTAAAARGRPCPGARHIQRDQPGHRGADRRRPRARKRIPAHARALHGRQLPVPGEIWLRHGRRGRGRADALVGRNVFALHPHQTMFDLPAEAVVPLPADVPLPRAALAANVETALNAAWDAAGPGTGPSGRIAVVGAGVVGALAGFLCAQIEGAEVTLVDIDPAREALARALGVEVRHARRCAHRLRFRLSRQRHSGGAGHRAQHRRATRRPSSS